MSKINDSLQKRTEPILKSIIDPHVHFFDLNTGDYQWLKPNNAPHWPDKLKIHKDFSESDLAVNSPLSLAGFVHIEAGYNNAKPWQEIQWLENTCNLPFRSIAFIDITQEQSDFSADLHQLTRFRSVVGVRYIFDESEIITLLSKSNIIDNLKSLAEHNMVFELQIPLSNAKAVDAFCKILNKCPRLHVAINHAGFPPRNKSINDWEQALAKLSQHKNVIIKCSGWEMTDRKYVNNWMVEIIAKALHYFSENRVLLASNFPLVLFSRKYENYWQNIYSALSFDNKMIEKLLYDNSYDFYRFNEINN